MNWPLGILAWLFRRLLPGSIGEDARAELEAEYRRRRDLAGMRSAWVWYAVHLFHPDTWRLALSLRRAEARRPDDHGLRPVRARRVAAFSPLDLKLASRMLVRYPGLTLTAGAAIAFAVTLAAASFEFFTDVFRPTLPIEAPRELVEIRVRDTQGMDLRVRIIDHFEAWRDQLRSVGEVGAFEPFLRTLRTESGDQRTLSGVSITAAAFQVARVQPLLGRGLVAGDEAAGAPPAVVIGFEVWRSLFAGDPGVLGRTVQVESEPAVVVGVMPEGFRFPRNEDLWTPFRHSASDFGTGEGPAIQVVARLADGASLADARAELAAVGLRTAADVEPGDRLRPEVVPYGHLPLRTHALVTTGIYAGSVLFFALLAVLVFGNVALLLFARTAAREREIVVRSALGASRARIMAQLVAEALVLVGIAGAVGLAAAEAGLGLLTDVLRQLQGTFFGYWVGDDLSPRTALYTVLLMVSGAVACGVLPTLRITGRTGPASRGGLGRADGSPRIGRLWSTVIVSQVAATVAFMAPLIVFGIETRAFQRSDFGFPAEEYLSVRLRMDRPPVPGTTIEASGAVQTDRYLAEVAKLEERLEDELGADAVTAAEQVPGGYHRYARVEVDGAVVGTSASVHRVQSVRVDPDFFAALRIPIVAGRPLAASDVGSSDPVVVVNEDLARVVFGDRSPVGHRLRYVGATGPAGPGPWYEVVGVVKQVAMNTDPNEPHSAGIYHPLARADVPQLRLITRVGPEAVGFAPRLHALTAAVTPSLQALDVRPVSEAAWDRALAHVALFWLMLGGGGMAVLLVTSGIHAVTSFTVSRRTREIGVRVALGSNGLRVAWAMLSRTLWQVAVGVAAGGTVAAGVLYAFLVGVRHATSVAFAHVAVFLAYLGIMVAVCLLATFVPVTRALRIEPTEALKAD